MRKSNNGRQKRDAKVSKLRTKSRLSVRKSKAGGSAKVSKGETFHLQITELKKSV